MTKPVAPVLGAITAVSSSQLTLTWNNVTGNNGYKVERKIGAGVWSEINSTGANVTTFTDIGLSAGTVYYYRISANSDSGYSVTSNEQFTTTTPATPSTSLNAVSAVQVDVSWGLVKSATNYVIQEKVGAGGYGEIANLSVAYGEDYCGDQYPTAGCPALTPKTNIYQMGGLTENTNYCYQVKAWNSTGGYSPYSTEHCVTTPFAPPVLPGQNLIGTAINAFKIKLDWTMVACDPACETPDGFELERETASGTWVKIRTLDNATFSYIDTISIAPNNRYSYRIRTYQGAYKSDYSSVANVTTPLFSAGSMSCP